jgi:hypothetical protein
MAIPSRRLIDALRATASRLDLGAPYEWGHMGRCNCGNLAQQLCGRPAEEIHRMALVRSGDWSEQSLLYCPSSGYELDTLFDLLGEAGLAPHDIRHLENVSDPDILARLPLERRRLLRNRREHAIVYMRAWADLLEERLVEGRGGIAALRHVSGCFAPD